MKKAKTCSKVFAALAIVSALFLATGVPILLQNKGNTVVKSETFDSSADLINVDGAHLNQWVLDAFLNRLNYITSTAEGDLFTFLDRGGIRPYSSGDIVIDYLYDNAYEYKDLTIQMDGMIWKPLYIYNSEDQPMLQMFCVGGVRSEDDYPEVVDGQVVANYFGFEVDQLENLRGNGASVEYEYVYDLTGYPVYALIEEARNQGIPLLNDFAFTKTDWEMFYGESYNYRNTPFSLTDIYSGYGFYYDEYGGESSTDVGSAFDMLYQINNDSGAYYFDASSEELMLFMSDIHHQTNIWMPSKDDGEVLYRIAEYYQTYDPENIPSPCLIQMSYAADGYQLYSSGPEFYASKFYEGLNDEFLADSEFPITLTHQIFNFSTGQFEWAVPPDYAENYGLASSYDKYAVRPFISVDLDVLYKCYYESSCDITINNDGGGNNYTVWPYAGDAWADLSITKPTKRGSIFLGYYDRPGNVGTQYFDANLNPTFSQYVTQQPPSTLYAHWKEVSNWSDLASGKNFANSGHQGTESDPYLIESAEDFSQMAVDIAAQKYTSSSFKLVADIDLGGLLWTPIANFSGYFDGGNHTIKNLTINSNAQYVGLFSYLGGYPHTRLFNIVLDGGSVVSTYSAGEYGGVGAILGYNSQNYVSNCHSSVNVTGYANVGGIVGNINYHGGVSNCTNSGNITATNLRAGGIVGYANVSYSSGDTISGCFNYGDIKGGQYVGGIAGSTGADIVNCLSDCTVIANDYAGILAGSSCNISQSAAYGFLQIENANATNVAGIVAQISATYSITGCSVNAASNLSAAKINMFYAGSTAPQITACYSRIGLSKQYVSNCSDWSQYYCLVDNLNDNLPMQKTLFTIAQGAQTSHSAILQRLKNQGFGE